MVIFVCGVVTGALVIKTQDWHQPPPSRVSVPRFGVPGPQPVNDILHQMALAHIDLTSEQANAIVKIMLDRQAASAEIRKTIAPALHAEVVRAYDDINQVLRPDQQPKFAELRKEREQRNEGLGSGRARRGGDGGGSRRTNRDSTDGLLDDGHGGMPRRVLPNIPSTNGP